MQPHKQAFERLIPHGMFTTDSLQGTGYITSVGLISELKYHMGLVTHVAKMIPKRSSCHSLNLCMTKSTIGLDPNHVSRKVGLFSNGKCCKG